MTAIEKAELIKALMTVINSEHAKRMIRNEAGNELLKVIKIEVTNH